MLLGQRDIGERVFDISTAFGPVVYCSGVARQRFQKSKSLVQSGVAPRSDIEHSSGTFCGRSGAGQEVGGDGIVNVIEVAALLAVAKNRGLFTAQHLQTKF